MIFISVKIPASSFLTNDPKIYIFHSTIKALYERNPKHQGDASGVR